MLTFTETARALAREKKNWNAVIFQSHNLSGLQYMKGDYKSAFDNLGVAMRLNRPRLPRPAKLRHWPPNCAMHWTTRDMPPCSVKWWSTSILSMSV